MSDELRKAAQAVIERLDSTSWEWTKQGPTADVINELRRKLANDEWQSTIETGPRDGTSERIAEWCINQLRQQTHWKPLPPPPETSK